MFFSKSTRNDEARWWHLPRVARVEEKKHGRNNTQVFSSDSRGFDIEQLKGTRKGVWSVVPAALQRFVALELFANTQFKSLCSTAALLWKIVLSMVICVFVLLLVSFFTISLLFRLWGTGWCAVGCILWGCSSHTPAHIHWFTIWKVDRGSAGTGIHRGCYDKHEVQVLNILYLDLEAVCSFKSWDFEHVITWTLKLRRWAGF